MDLEHAWMLVTIIMTLTASFSFIGLMHDVNISLT